MTDQPKALEEIRDRAKRLKDQLNDRRHPIEVELAPRSEKEPPKETVDAFEALSRLLQNPDFYVWYALIRERVDKLLDEAKPDISDEATMRYALSLRYFARHTADVTVEFVEKFEAYLAQRQAWEASKTANPGVHTTPPAP